MRMSTSVSLISENTHGCRKIEGIKGIRGIKGAYTVDVRPFSSINGRSVRTYPAGI